jgi:putative phosphoesterase
LSKKIGIISDTHSKIGRAIKGIDLLIKEGAELIVHAGDIVKIEILEYLKTLNIPYIAVYGNNDKKLTQYHNNFNLVSEPNYFNFKDLSFKLMHHPLYLSPDADVIISGHTHDYKVEMINGTLFVNPGEVCARDYPLSSVVLLEYTKKEFIITRHTRMIKNNNWLKEKKTYKRQ